MIYNRPNLSKQWNLGIGVNVLSDYPLIAICECSHTWGEHHSGYGARTRKRIDLCLKCQSEFGRKVWNEIQVEGDKWVSGEPRFEWLDKICMEFKEKIETSI